MEYVALNNGVKMPMSGYGVFKHLPKKPNAVLKRLLRLAIV